MAITPATSKSAFETIEKLAREIIPEFYSDTIPHEHNIFFVEKFQTVKAIEDQISAGYEYYLISTGVITIGYFGIQSVPGTNTMNLSKLYLLKKYRGMGFGTIAMNFTIDRAMEKNFSKIVLIVTRENSRTINLYTRFGFYISKDLDIFEDGHRVHYYEMTKELKIRS